MKNNDILISIIVPVYNVEKYIERCIDSIIKQKYENLEILLIDDGSTDRSSDICDEYVMRDNRIRVIHKENGGQSSARNMGLKIAKGDYISFVDSDDWIAEDLYSYSVTLIEEYNADIVAFSYVLTNKKVDILNTSKECVNIYNSAEALYEYFNYGMKSRISDYPVWNKLYKKELFEGIEFPEGKIYEDYIINAKLIKNCNRYVRSNRKFYFYFQGDKSTVRNGFRAQDYDLITQCEDVCELVSKENNQIIKLAQDKLERSYFSLILKIALYGFDNKLTKRERQKILKLLIVNYRRCYNNLLKSNMPFNRKLLLPIVYIDYRLLFFVRVINMIGINR